jgi:hypothetical protein
VLKPCPALMFVNGAGEHRREIKLIQTPAADPLARKKDGFECKRSTRGLGYFPPICGSSSLRLRNSS